MCLPQEFQDAIDEGATAYMDREAHFKAAHQAAPAKAYAIMLKWLPPIFRAHASQRRWDVTLSLEWNGVENPHEKELQRLHNTHGVDPILHALVALGLQYTVKWKRHDRKSTLYDRGFRVARDIEIRIPYPKHILKQG